MIDLKNLREDMEFLAFNDVKNSNVPAIQVIELLDMLDAAQKDAARYQWRKENSQVRIGRFKYKYRAETQNSVLTDWFDTHDEAIDAAMQS